MPVLEFYYRNYRGELGYRKVQDPKLSFKETEHHKGQQWIMTAFDLDKQDFREFAVKDIIEFL